ncbi:MAG: DUF86 domain-containing protein [Actinobacteria bacterium]|nr:DUF86 domain-containing protein [Actinomycetota bacterium]
MTRSELKRLQDILECSNDLAELVALGRLEFYENKFWAMAAARLLETIGEASTHLPQDLIAKFPGIEWKKIAAMRILIAHAYHRVDIDFIWTIATTSVPDLAQKIRAQYPNIDESV